MGFDWQWDYSIEILPALLHATINTVIATFAGFAVAMVLGVVFLAGQRTRYPLVSWLFREFVEFIRTTPLLVQVFFVFYVGPQFGVLLSPWVAGMTAIGVHYGAYLSEVYRGGLYAVPKGQWEACKALNLSPARTYLGIILPQAFPPCMPGISLYLVGCFKDTPVLSVIAVTELLNTASVLGTMTYRYLEPYTIAGLIFLVLSLITVACLSMAERRLRKMLGLPDHRH